MKFNKNQTGTSNKRNDSIRKLSQNLFAKFQNSSKDIATGEDMLSKFALDYVPVLNPVQNLISKANMATKNNVDKINLARKSKRQQQSHTFLTGTGIYQNKHSYPPKEQIQVPQGPSHLEILKNLIQNEDFDDLAELRKMLRQTGQNIQDCRRKVYKTQKSIANYASNNSFAINSMNTIMNRHR